MRVYRSASDVGQGASSTHGGLPVALVDDSSTMHTVWVRDRSSVTRVRIVTLSYGAVYNPGRAYPIVVKWVSGGLDFDDIRTLYVVACVGGGVVCVCVGGGGPCVCVCVCFLLGRGK